MRHRCIAIWLAAQMLFGALALTAELHQNHLRLDQAGLFRRPRACSSMGQTFSRQVSEAAKPRSFGTALILVFAPFMHHIKCLLDTFGPHI